MYASWLQSWHPTQFMTNCLLAMVSLFVKVAELHIPKEDLFSLVVEDLPKIKATLQHYEEE